MDSRHNFQALEDQREENNLPKLHEDQQQGRMLVIDEAKAARELMAVAKELTASWSSSNVQTTLENNGCHPDEVWKRGGDFVAARGFFYTHGYDSDKWTKAVTDALDKAGVRHQVVDSGEEWKDFRGGAPLRRQSHWWVQFKILENSKVARGRTSEFGDNIIAEAINGKVEAVGKGPQGRTDNANYLIVCDMGDWSGFMRMDEAIGRLKVLAKRHPLAYYAVVER